jgi:hypothetical protein
VGKTPLWQAQLLEHDSLTRESREETLWSAAWKGHEEVVRLLLKQDSVSLDFKLEAIWHRVVVGIVKELIEKERFNQGKHNLD